MKTKQIINNFGKKIEILEDWKISSLSELSHKIKAGGTPKSNQRDYYNGNIAFTSIKDITKSQRYLEKTVKTITQKGLENSNAWIIPRNSLLYSMYATVGKSIINKIDTATHQGILGILINKDKIDNEFLCYALQFIKPTLSKYILTNTQSNINLEISKNLKILHPQKIHEQQEITSFLSNIDDLISEIQNEIKKIKKLKREITSILLTKGINHTKFKKVKLSSNKEITIPYNWTINSLSTLTISFLNGIYKHEKFYGSGIPNVRMYNIQDGQINKNNILLVDVTDKEKDKFSLLLNDILINRVNSDVLVGKSGIVPKDYGDATFESKNIRIRVKTEKCNPKYLNYFLNSSYYFSQLRLFIQTAIGQATINQNDLKKIMIPTPELDEQKQIVNIFENMDDLITEEKTYLQEITQTKKGLMQKLLTGKIRVPLS